MENFCEYIGFASTLLGTHIDSVMGMVVPTWHRAQSRAVLPPACDEVPGIGMLKNLRQPLGVLLYCILPQHYIQYSRFDSSLGLHVYTQTLSSLFLSFFGIKFWPSECNACMTFVCYLSLSRV